MGNTANFTGINKDRYIQTNGTGSLIQQVGVNWVSFPVGNSTFNPARLKNDGTIDNFSIRVVDHFLQNGTAGNAITANVIPRTWLIDEETVGGSDVSMRLIWRPLHHNNNGFDTNNSSVTHFTGGSWQDQTAGASIADNSYSSDHRYREATNITSFSPFGVKSGGGVLPVELLYFYAKQVKDGVQLDWETATELNNSHFEVEWSKDGISFEKIGEVTGAGTTNEVQFYEFLHDRNLAGFQNLRGLNYYRLKQVDFDGKFEYSETVQITIIPKHRETQSNHQAINIFPNPASNFITFENLGTIEAIHIFSIQGQLVKEIVNPVSSIQYPVSDLPSGTYFVKIEEQVQKIIIAK